MSIFSRFTGLLTRGGRDDEQLKQGLDHAKANRLPQAIAIYTTLFEDRGTSGEVRARALFNRALAYSALKDDQRALADLNKVLALPGLPENVQIAARSQLARVRKRGEKET